ncbi:hypothetical protein [Priestia megaterium]|uniref:hypothetical protein n=1 Tax=Priestia megaterium TaxID=1404 RepID=UPI002363502E|nr:hypothetical protein [Priestia megaterium]MDD1515917.1 hypothetical protein [Priestia megaterium]
MKVVLSVKQEELKKIIINNLAIAKDWENQTQDTIQEAFKNMKEAAHELHMQLDPKPKHHSYMIKNRGMSPDDPEFYDHIHPVEDLLDYLADTSANDDPVDNTIGDKFEFLVYSNRWGHKDRYELTRTKNGWYISHLSYNGEDILNEEMKVLTKAMRHDSISFPVNVSSYMESIWIQARDQGLQHEEVQNMLDRVADWISQTEMNAPEDLLI